VKGFDEAFDERRYGFAGIVDALRFGQREGLFRLERDRQGVVRVHPGAQYLKLTKTGDGNSPVQASEPDDVSPDTVAHVEAPVSQPADERGEAPEAPAPAAETLPFDAAPVSDAPLAPRPDVPADVIASGEAPADEPAAGAPAPRGRKQTRARKSVAGKKPAAAPAPAGAKKKTARPRARKA
jgi:hypothetical protein